MLFPPAGYDGVPDFFQVLLRLIQRSLHPDQVPAAPTFRPAACTECAKVAPPPRSQCNNGVVSYRTITHINGYSTPPDLGPHHGHGKEAECTGQEPPSLPNGLAMMGRNHNVFVTEAGLPSSSQREVSVSQP